MEEKKRKTVGEISYELAQKPQDQIEVGDIAKQEEARYLEALHSALERGQKKFEGDFFVEVRLKKERIIANALPRIYAVERFTCPTPFYGHDVFHYVRKGNEIHYLWSVPNPDICEYLKQNRMMLNDDEKFLLKCIMAHESGELLLMCNKLNGEKPKSLDLEKKLIFTGV